MAKPRSTIPVNQYFGRPIGNGQEPDELYDKTSDSNNQDGMRIAGKGSQGGGSRPTPQAKRMTTGSGSRGSRVSITSSHPKAAQKLRG
jgi:hypothetical protein